MDWDYLTAHGAWLGAGVLGLLVGSFLNVVIHRLPLMLQRQWARECADFSGQPVPDDAPAFNLLVPRSRCPHCQHPIAWHQNLPLLSFALQGGRCAHCQGRIGWRYPLVEALTGALFAAVAAQHGAHWGTLAWRFEPWKMPLDVQMHCGVRIGHDYPAPCVPWEPTQRAAREQLRACQPPREARIITPAAPARRSRPQPAAPQQLALGF